MWILFPIFKFQIDSYVILDTDEANQVNYFSSMQNYANSQLNLITLVALNINSVQFYQETKKIFNCLLRQHFFAICKYPVDINDLPCALEKSQPDIYADDTSIFTSGNDLKILEEMQIKIFSMSALGSKQTNSSILWNVYIWSLDHHITFPLRIIFLT